MQLPSVNFLETLLDNQRLCILADYPMYRYLDNIRMKFVEGCGFDTIQLVEPLEFVHGTYQCLENQRLLGRQTVIIWFNNETSQDVTDKLDRLLVNYPRWTLTSELPYSQKILEYELVVNELILQIMDYLDISQTDWPGKSTQGILYD